MNGEELTTTKGEGEGEGAHFAVVGVMPDTLLAYKQEDTEGGGLCGGCEWWGRVVSSVRERVHLSPSLSCRELGTGAKARRRRCEVNEGGRAGGRGRGQGARPPHCDVDEDEGDGASSSSTNPRRPRRRIIPVVTSSSPCSRPRRVDCRGGG